MPFNEEFASQLLVQLAGQLVGVFGNVMQSGVGISLGIFAVFRGLVYLKLLADPFADEFNAADHFGDRAERGGKRLERRIQKRGKSGDWTQQDWWE